LGGCSINRFLFWAWARGLRQAWARPLACWRAGVRMLACWRVAFWEACRLGRAGASARARYQPGFRGHGRERVDRVSRTLSDRSEVHIKFERESLYVCDSTDTRLS